MARHPRTWDERTGHVAPFDDFSPDDRRYVAHIEGRRDVIEERLEPFGSVEEAVAWALERAPVVRIRRWGEDVLWSTAGERGHAAWPPTSPAPDALPEATHAVVEVRQGFGRRSAAFTRVLVERLAGLDDVVEVARGRDVGDMRLLDDPPACGPFGLAVPDGGRLTCACLVRAAERSARELVEEELHRVLAEHGHLIRANGPSWSVRAEGARRSRLFSPLDEFEERG